MIRLLAIDIDGTLLNSQGQVSPAHRRALAEAGARRIAIALVTGRSVHFAHPVADALPVPVTLVASNGAIVKDAHGETRLRRLLPRDAARQVLAEMEAFGDSVALVFDAPGIDGRPEAIVYDRMDWTRPNRQRYYERNRAFIRRMAPLAAALVDDPIQVMFNGEVVPMRDVARRLRALSCAGDFSLQVTEYENRDFALVDVNRRGCSKGTTLAAWAGELGIGRDEVMAVGDNLNDLDMLEFAGTPVVMGNACEALRDHASRNGWMVGRTHDEDGLADVIYRLAW
jgi:Cof subfamily protein (haloacid dehalogenase superfamily)